MNFKLQLKFHINSKIFFRLEDPSVVNSVTTRLTLVNELLEATEVYQYLQKFTNLQMFKWHFFLSPNTYNHILDKLSDFLDYCNDHERLEKVPFETRFIIENITPSVSFLK